MLGFAKSVLPKNNCQLNHASYSQLNQILQELEIESVDRVLLDLGLSSDQLSDESRGFSFQSEGELDLRFDLSKGQPAWKLLQDISEEQLCQILQEYGEEKFSPAIAKQLVFQRKKQSIRTADDLVAAVTSAIPRKALKSSRKHPATRVFQALRIAVNEELTHLEKTLESVLYDSISPGGRAVIITFHSLEDRLVKREFRNQHRWENVTKKPILASPIEQRMNPRSRTAKLRAVIRK